MKIRIAKVTDDPPVKVDNNLRQHWNDYVTWLASRGLKGSPALDKNGTWGIALEQYRKENPNTLITKEKIPLIQKDFQNYRQYVIDKIKQGKGQYAAGTNENNFMKDLSIVDGIAGSKTTNFQYPNEFLKTFEDGKLISNENKGFAIK